MFERWYAHILEKRLLRPYVHLIFGARQTGKSTLIQSLLPADALRIDLSSPAVRTRYLSRPGDFVQECRSLPTRRRPRFVFVDEAQAVPELFNAVQHLYDGDKTRWRFVLCGSSARKLRTTGVNLLPGRSMLHRLQALTLAEHPPTEGPSGDDISPLPFPWPKHSAAPNLFPPADLTDHLAYGELPGIVAAKEKDRAELLRTYAVVHLEEEIRREALVRDWGAFVRFLELAAAESGKILNYAAISQEAGIAQPTVKGYYQLLEDMFVGFQVPAYSGSPRKNLLSTSKFFFFDLGVRHAAQDLPITRGIVKADPGAYFEQWVGIELWKRLQYLGSGRLHHLRTKDGAEVDFIIDTRRSLIPIEVKFTEHPTLADARHLLTFVAENPRKARQGYVICRCPRPMQLSERITALPWQCL